MSPAVHVWQSLRSASSSSWTVCACGFPRRAMRRTLKTQKEGIQAAPHFLVSGATGNQVKEYFIKTMLGKKTGNNICHVRTTAECELAVRALRPLCIFVVWCVSWSLWIKHLYNACERNEDKATKFSKFSHFKSTWNQNLTFWKVLQKPWLMYSKNYQIKKNSK